MRSAAGRAHARALRARRADPARGPCCGYLRARADRADLLTSPRYVGLENFRDLLADPVFREALASTLFVAFAVPLRLAVAPASRCCCTRASAAPARRAAAFLPTVVPDIAYALLWLFLVNPLYGPINGLLGLFGLPGVVV